MKKLILILALTLACMGMGMAETAQAPVATLEMTDGGVMHIAL